MGARRPALPVVAGAVGAALVLGLAAAWLWRTLPVFPEEPRSARDRPAVGAPAPDFPEDLPSVFGEPSLDGVRFLVLEAAESRAMTGAGVHDAERALWRRWLTGMGAREVDGEAADADVIVAPDAVCLAAGDRRRIVRHLERGGGLVATGLLGARDGACSAAPDTLLLDLVGGTEGSVTPTDPASAEAIYAVVPGGSLLGAGLPPGVRLEVALSSGVAFSGDGRLAHYATWERTPERRRNGTTPDGAIVRSRAGEGRAVAFGFAPGRTVEGWSRDVARVMAGNAVAWSAGRPVARLAPWPAPYRSAALLAHDAEAEFGNAARAARVLEKAELPATFFVVGRLAREHPGVTRRLSRAGEIATHTEEHEWLDRFPADEQLERLRRARRGVERIAGRAPPGLRPPAERFDRRSLEAWARLGGDYVFSFLLYRSAGPEMIPVGADTLVFLGRAAHDDFDLLERSDGATPAAVRATMLRQLEEAAAVRGLYAFSFHTQVLARTGRLPLLEVLAETLKRMPEVWVAEAREIARWWRARAAVRIEVPPDGSPIRVVNGGSGPFADGVLLVDGPAGGPREVALPRLDPGEAVELPAGVLPGRSSADAARWN